MQSIKQIVASKTVEQDLGKLNPIELLDTLRQVEKLRAEMRAHNPNIKYNVLKALDGTFKLIMQNVKVL